MARDRPEGIAGDAAYEPGSFLYNPVGEWHAKVDGQRVIRRRIDIMSERTGLNRERVLGWPVEQGIVSSAWDYEGSDGSDRGWQFCEQVAAWALELLG